MPDTPEMANEKQIVVRVPDGIVVRAKALAKRLPPGEGALSTSTAAVYRRALLRGLDVLEAENPTKPRVKR